MRYLGWLHRLCRLVTFPLRFILSTTACGWLAHLLRTPTAIGLPVIRDHGGTGRQS